MAVINWVKIILKLKMKYFALYYSKNGKDRGTQSESTVRFLFFQSMPCLLILAKKGLYQLQPLIPMQIQALKVISLTITCYKLSHRNNVLVVVGTSVHHYL